MSGTSAALAGRAAAERLMLDAGKAQRPTGTRSYDSGTQAETDTFTDLFGPIPCKLQARGLMSRTHEVGDRTATTVRIELHLPASSAPLTTGDIWEMTSVSDVSTSEVGERFRVIAPFAKTLGTARRYEVDRVVS